MSHLVLLKAEVEFWRRVQAGLEVDAAESPLCRAYRRTWFGLGGAEITCPKCPIKILSGKSGCNGTPYVRWDDHQCEKHNENQRRQKMVAACPTCVVIIDSIIDYLKGISQTVQSRRTR